MNKEKLEQSMKDLQEVIEKEFEDGRTTQLDVSFVVTRSGFHNVVVQVMKEQAVELNLIAD